MNPLEAATDPDPYASYAKLLSEQPLAYDQTLVMRVAASAEVVSAVLTDPRCRVRPVAEPVPASPRGSSAGDIFSRLVRMTDGPGHEAVKQAVTTALASVAQAEVATEDPACSLDPGSSFALALSLPAFVVGNLLGIPDDALPQMTRWLDDFVRGPSPAAGPADVERATIAADHLRALMATLMDSGETHPDANLLRTLGQELHRAGFDDPALVVAYGIGFLFQTYEATAGLIGNTLLTLAAPDLLEQVMAEVLRYDPPIQNTRRFVAADATIAGQRMKSGDVILVVLDAANRDPALNHDPDRFVASRGDRGSFSFGVGAHACPGTALALTIATAGVAEILAADRDFWQQTGVAIYRPSVNARVPIRIEESTPKEDSG